MTKLYIDPNAPDNTGAGTAASPKKTPVGLTIAPGDTIYFKRGTSYTGAFTLSVQGTRALPITFDAYANLDGTDALFMDRPVINITSAFSTYGSANKDYVRFYNLDIRATLAVTADAAAVYLGHGARMSACKIVSNVGAVAAWGKSDVVISLNEFDGVTHANTANNNVLTVSDTKNMDDIQILFNRVIHRGGGGSSSHALRLDTGAGAYAISNLVVQGNHVGPPDGVVSTPNVAAIGIRLARCPNAIIRSNRVHGMLSGVFVTGGGAMVRGVRLMDNDLSDNLNFGIHCTTDTRDFMIERNVCDRNGTDQELGATLHAYGRGIELTSAFGNGSCGGHTVRFNKARYNRNYGGPNDNGSEGCGLGLDDGVDHCIVYANDFSFNEGNGIQLYGGTGTDTGGHVISGNVLHQNCTASFNNRRTGGVLTNAFNAHIGCGSTKGSQTVIANNYFSGATKVAVSKDANCNNIKIANNIFDDVPYPICAPAIADCDHNLFWARTVAMQRYSNVTLGGNGVPTFPALPGIGTNDFAFDPQLDARKRPLAGSPVIMAGKYLMPLRDAAGRLFAQAPSIGPYELNTNPLAA